MQHYLTQYEEIKKSKNDNFFFHTVCCLPLPWTMTCCANNPSGREEEMPWEHLPWEQEKEERNFNGVLVVKLYKSIMYIKLPSASHPQLLSCELDKTSLTNFTVYIFKEVYWADPLNANNH